MVKYFKTKFDQILDQKIDLLFCNRDEAIMYSGKKNFDECCKYLLNISEMVVITDGKKGSLILTENKKIKIKPHKVNAIDTVGAGDTYAGAFLYGINNGMSLEQSGNLASLLSSKVVTKLGPRLEKDIIDDIKLSIG